MSERDYTTASDVELVEAMYEAVGEITNLADEIHGLAEGKVEKIATVIEERHYPEAQRAFFERLNRPGQGSNGH